MALTKEKLLELVENGDIPLAQEAGSPNYEYGGRNLMDVFGTAAALHEAVAAGDFSKIRVGDYWPISLTGSFYDRGDSATKSLSSAVLKMEVAGINTYRQYGGTLTQNHLMMCSRDCLPVLLKLRSTGSTWYNTGVTNPWRGTALYETLNNPTDGLVALLNASDLGSGIYAGPNNAGMRFAAETKAAAATAATGWSWIDRGKLFLPTEREIWGAPIWSENPWGAGLAVQWEIFRNSLRHIIKGLGDGGSGRDWWYSSSQAGSAANFCLGSNRGIPYRDDAGSAYGVPVCFLFV